MYQCFSDGCGFTSNFKAQYIPHLFWFHTRDLPYNDRPSKVNEVLVMQGHAAVRVEVVRRLVSPGEINDIPNGARWRPGDPVL